MRRREFITLVSAAAAMWPFAARARQPTTPVIGFLSPGSSSVSYFLDGLREGLSELGYIDGQNIRIETRCANGRFEKLPQLAIELVHLNVEVLVASLTQASLEAKKATATIPIVMAGVGDPAAVGLIASLSHPGGNVTGTSSLLSSDIVGKQLELLKEIFPGVSGVAVLWNPANASFQALQLRQAEQAAKAGGLQLQLFEARSASEFDAVFARVEKGTRALAVLGDPLFAIYAETIAELALKHSEVRGRRHA
jgi:putative ABC transport system substrate-binding protein